MEETRYSFSEAEYQAIMKKVEDCSAFERKVLAERDAALAWGEAMREALEEIRECVGVVQISEKYRAEGSDCLPGLVELCGIVDAALSTPAPAALEALKRRVRDEALEEAAKHIEDETKGSGGYVDTEIQWAAAAIRAMKEGEGWT